MPNALDRMPAHKVRAAWLAGTISNDEYGQWVERRTFAKRAQRRLVRTYRGRGAYDVAALDKLPRQHADRMLRTRAPIHTDDADDSWETDTRFPWQSED